MLFSGCQSRSENKNAFFEVGLLRCSEEVLARVGVSVPSVLS